MYTKSFRWLFFLFVAAGIPALASARSESLTLSARIDKDSIRIGDQVKYTLHAGYHTQLPFQFPAFQDTLTKDLLVISAGPLDTLRYDRKKQWIEVERTYTLTSFSGQTRLSVPAMAYTVPSPSGMDTIRTESLSLRVFFPPIDSTFVPHDIYDPVKYPIVFSEIKPYLLAVHLLLLAAILIYMFVRKLRRKEPLFGTPEPVLAPHIQALSSLSHIRSEKRWLSVSNKVFYTEVTNILREYLDAEYGLSTMEKTSEEILADVEKIDRSWLPQSSLLILADILHQADLAKFAKTEWSTTENENGLNQAIHFVEETHRKEDPKNA